MEPVEFDWMQTATFLKRMWPWHYAQVAEVGRSNTVDTLPDH